MNILYINGHPDAAASFHGAIQRAYVSGIDTKKHEVKIYELGTLNFDPVLRFGYRQRMAPDDVIDESQALIAWADHIVFAYPIWWGGMPSLLTGWIARVFTPGFAYNTKGLFTGITQRLKGKTSDIIITSRAPRSLWGVLGNGGALTPLTRNLFVLCGIQKRKLLVYSGVTLRRDTRERREKFLKSVRRRTESL